MGLLREQHSLIKNIINEMPLWHRGTMAVRVVENYDYELIGKITRAKSMVEFRVCFTLCRNCLMLFIGTKCDYVHTTVL